MSKLFSYREAKVEEPNAYQDTEGWVSPKGKFYPLDGALSHGQWIVNNYEWLTSVGRAQLPPYNELKKDVISKGSDYVRNLLVGQGWLHVYNPRTISVRSLRSQEGAVTDYLLLSGNGYSDNDVIEVYSLDNDRWTSKTFKQWKGEDDDDGFSAFGSRTASVGWKAWVNTDTNEVLSWGVNGEGSPHHVDRLPEDIEEDLHAAEIEDGNEQIEYAVGQGWFQVAIDGGYLYITVWDEDDVEDIIKLLPVEYTVTVKDIITDAGNAKVDEGEDPLKAWRMRNSIRKRVSSIKLSSRDAVKDTIDYWDKAKNKDFSKYWRQLKKKKKKKSSMQLSTREAALGDFGKNKRWRANLKVYDIIKKYEDNPENYQNVSYKIFKRIMRNVDGYKFLLKDKKDRLKAMAQEFCDLKDKKFKNRKEFEAAFNILFEKLYKFADKNKIWIG